MSCYNMWILTVEMLVKYAHLDVQRSVETFSRYRTHGKTQSQKEQS